MKPHLNKADWLVADIPFAIGKSLVSEYHYSRGGSNTFVYMHGLIRRVDMVIMGVAWWLPPTRVACESVNRAEWKRVLSLTRLALHPDVPTNGASFLMARSIKMIERDGRFVSLVTYADESQGHTGQIYKATNWKYIGRTGPYPRWVDPVTGRQVAQKATKNRVKSQMLALGYQKVGAFCKHKYVMHLSVPKK